MEGVPLTLADVAFALVLGAAWGLVLALWV